MRRRRQIKAARDNWQPWLLLDAHVFPWQVRDFTHDELAALVRELKWREGDG